MIAFIELYYIKFSGSLETFTIDLISSPKVE